MMLRIRGGLALVVLASLAGCNSGGTTAPKALARPLQGARITVAAVGDPKLIEVVAPQRGEWQVSRGAEVTLRAEAVEPREAARAADVLIFPGDRLGALVEARALAVLPETVVRPPSPRPAGEVAEKSAATAPPDPFQFDDIIPSYRDEVSRYGEDRLALPLGGSALVLVYRRDAFSRPENVAAAKQAGITLEPPRTWEGLDALARFFHRRDWDGDGRDAAGIALAWGPDAEGVGDAAFLARAAALGLRPDQYSFAFHADSMEPRLTSPPFARALDELRSLQACGPEDASTLDAEGARAAFREGRVALLIDRAERASRWTDPKHPVPAGVARLPGSARVFDPDRDAWEPISPPNRPSYLPIGGGWLVGVSSSSAGKTREAAIDFLKYLTGPETSARILADRVVPMLPVRQSELGVGIWDPRSAPGVDGSLWAKAVAQTLLEPRVVVGLRIPDADRFLADLDRARSGSGPAESALKAAARAWADRVKAAGFERLRWHYRRSLTKIPTPPEPPAEGKGTSG
jgi:multiple sugar transport system substrate-binding protein